MIHYHQWLSNDPADRRAKAHQNGESAARIYASLKPLRSAFGGLTSALWHGLRAAGALSRQKAAIRELNKLDDRLLKDIGVSRGQIPGIVRTGRRATARNQKHPNQPNASRSLVASRQACDVIKLDTIRQSADSQSCRGQSNSGKKLRLVRSDLTAA